MEEETLQPPSRGFDSDPRPGSISHSEDLLRRPRFNKSGLHRSKTVPAVEVTRVFPSVPEPPKQILAMDEHPDPPKSNFGSSGFILKWAATFLVIYLFGCILIHSTNHKRNLGVVTHPVIDAVYFSIVTLCTIGYGDIAPLTPATMAFTYFFVLIGFGLIEVLISNVVSYILDRTCRMQIWMKVGLTVTIMFVIIGVWTLAQYVLEHLDQIDSLYFSIMSVTAVGNRDQAFFTKSVRIFASIWLLVSTLAMMRVFLFLVEFGINKRQGIIAKRALHKNLTKEDLIAADPNHNGFISESDFVLYKLKDMGKIGEEDIQQIREQFNKLDPNNTGKIIIRDPLNTVNEP